MIRHRTIRTVLLLLVFLLATGPAGAHAGEAVSLDPLGDHEQGQEVQISGTTVLVELTVRVVRPDATTLFLDVVPAAGGRFETVFRLPSDALLGTYTVIAGSGEWVTSATFLVTGDTWVHGTVELPGRADNSGVTVTAANAGVEVSSRADGGFSLFGIPGGPEVLVLTRNTYLDSRVPVEVLGTADTHIPETVRLRPGDINSDGVVDILDLTLLASAYRAGPGDDRYDPDADLNGDGKIDILDLTLLAGSYRQTGDTE